MTPETEALCKRLEAMVGDNGAMSFTNRSSREMTHDISEAAAKLREMAGALEAVRAAMLNGGDGTTGDFGWSITKLNKARPLILAALAGGSHG